MAAASKCVALAVVCLAVSLLLVRVTCGRELVWRLARCGGRGPEVLAPPAHSARFQYMTSQE